MVEGSLDYTPLDGDDVFDPWTWPDVGGLLLRCRCMRPRDPSLRYTVLELRGLLDALRPGSPWVLAPRDICQTTRPHGGTRRRIR